MTNYKENLDELKRLIKTFKMSVMNAQEPLNRDYCTGYASAMSTVEGLIADIFEGDEDETDN